LSGLTPDWQFGIIETPTAATTTTTTCNNTVLVVVPVPAATTLTVMILFLMPQYCQQRQQKPTTTTNNDVECSGVFRRCCRIRGGDNDNDNPSHFKWMMEAAGSRL